MKLKLLEKIEVAQNTKSFYFEGEKKISWLPGQYYYFTLPKLTHPDPKGGTRHFTISTSPTEDKFGFTTRMREESGFKSTLDELAIGTLVDIEGPEGTFILDEHEKGSHIFLAGGIGITPFRSFIKYNIDKSLKDSDLHLLYANSTSDQITFMSDFETWSKENNNITVDLTVSKPDKMWRGLSGRIDENMIQTTISKHKIQNPTFWLCGPPGMVSAMENTLNSLKIPSGKTRIEKFTGYS